MSKIKVLVLPSDRTGVGKFRSVEPHIFLQNKFSEDFHVDIDYEPRVDDMNYWKQYDMVCFHRSIGRDYDIAPMIIQRLNSIPKKATVIRVHVAGDFFNQAYFNAWMEVAKKRTDIIFYAYTKSIGYWVNQLGNIPSNFKLNASYGGKQDNLIEQYNLKSVKVVYTVEQAGDMVIDHDDTSAFMQDKSFALLLHGVQPKGSDASKALSVLKKQGIHGYGKKKDVRELAVA